MRLSGVVAVFADWVDQTSANAWHAAFKQARQK
jgi:hypothetical protein